MSLGSRYWAARFATWGEPKPASAGYSLLVPVPGDLPVFLELALSVLATQDHGSRVETIVIPDQPTKQVTQVVQRHASAWNGPLRIELLPRPERDLLPRIGNPGHNHGVQLITGVQASSGSHIVLHDADLFLLEPDALERHYGTAVADDLAVCGVSPVWDQWFKENDIHLVATWELCARRDWMRSFPPYLHMGHVGEILEQQHIFDTTLHPQALTDPRKIGLREQDDSIVHFNYVISTYRHFAKSKGGFEDDRFRLLLIRLFVDLFAQVEANYALPSAEELRRGLGSSGTDVPVVYPPADEETKAKYADFRVKTGKILDGPWTDAAKRTAAAEALAPFDVFYGWAQS